MVCILFYGSQHDVAKYCQSKRFIKKYSVDGKYQYYRVIRDMPLFIFPYMSVVLFDAQEIIEALEAAKVCFEYLLYSNRGTSATIKKYRLGNTICDVNDVLIDMIDESDIPTENSKTYNRAIRLYRYYKKVLAMPISRPDERRRVNPDYSFASLICEMGYMGWVRKARHDDYFPGDELMICNLSNCISYLQDSSGCELDPSC